VSKIMNPEPPRSSNNSATTSCAVQSNPYDPAFAETDANIVLHSSDGTKYRIPSFTLRTTSGFFRDMMTLPQCNDPSLNRDDDYIILGETSKVLGTLFRMISGFETPRWASIDEVEDVLAAARKYDMPGPLAAIRSMTVTPLIIGEPLRLYAIAAQQGWEEEAKEASRHTLRLCIYDAEHASTLQRVPSPYLLRLFALHRTRHDQFRALSAREGGCFGLKARCDYCGGCQDWLPLVHRMMLEMDRRPLGDTLLGRQWMEWQETKSFLYNGTCKQRERCVEYNLHEPKIAAFLDNSLKSLPSTI